MEVIHFIIFCESTLRSLDPNPLIIPVNGIIQLGLQITGKAAGKGKQHTGDACV